MQSVVTGQAPITPELKINLVTAFDVKSTERAYFRIARN